jgi:hypothetical protein
MQPICHHASDLHSVKRFFYSVWIGGLFAIGLVSHGWSQEKSSVTPSVDALSQKYDEARRKQLGPLLNLLVQELTGKVVPKLTREGKAALAIEITEGAGKLREMKTPQLPREGMPFSKESFELLQTTDEWKQFSTGFAAAEATLNESYQRALDREKSVFQNQGNPYGVIAVENEWKRVVALRDSKVPSVPTPNSPASVGAPGQPPPGMPAEATGNPVGAPVSKTKSGVNEVSLKERFVGKGFRYYWEREKTNVLFYFRRNGEALREMTKEDGTISVNLGKWEIEDDGSVSVLGIASPKWFWFGTDGVCQLKQGVKEGKSDYTLTFNPDAKDPQK